MAFAIENVEKYQLSEIRFSPPRGWKMCKWEGISAYVYSIAYHTNLGDKIWI